MRNLLLSLDEATEPVDVFFRDDDAGWEDARLLELIARFAEHGVPLDLAVIPAELHEGLAARLADSHAGLHQHGYAHTNHQVEGRKCEFGPARARAEQHADIAAGQERLTELLSDENQNAISDILENVRATTDVLRERAPEIADTLAEARIAARNASLAAERVARLADSTNALVSEEGRPAMQDLRKAIAGVEQATSNLDAMVADARPGVQNFSKSTLPELNRLIRDMRELSQSLNGFVERLDRGGVGGALGPKKLPDYEPRGNR